MVTTRPPKTIVKPTALGPVANTDTKLLIYGLFQKGRVLAQDGYLFAFLEARRNEPHCCRPSTPSRNSPADPLPCVCRTDCMIGTYLSTKPLATCRVRPSRTAQRMHPRF